MYTSFVVVGLLAFLSGGPDGYEEPQFEVVEKFDDFEVRHYRNRIVARTTVDSDFDEAGEQAFPRLADYISDHRIAMTIPVSQRPAGSSPDAFEVEFGMPAAFAIEDLPQPADDRVELERVPERMVAALSYRGDWGRDRYDRHETELLAGLAREGLRPVAEPTWARYSSPLMVWFLRRNEILVEVEPIDAPTLACASARGR